MLSRKDNLRKYKILGESHVHSYGTQSITPTTLKYYSVAFAVISSRPSSRSRRYEIIKATDK